MGEEGEIPLRPDDSLYVAPNEKHALMNRAQGSFRFICLVPLRGEDTP
jgi:quercetin dioxygenase-like cupin family protein